MDQFDLRQAIIERVLGKPANELTDVIESSISQDEKTLPGLGVLFELIWKQSDPSARTTMVNALHQSLQNESSASVQA